MDCKDVCSTDPDFPQIREQFSLTNYIEIIRIDGICNTIQNNFHMVPFELRKTLKQNVASLNLTEDAYDIYIATITTNSLRLLPKSFSDKSVRRTTYFFINKNYDSLSRDELQKRLFEIYRVRDKVKGRFGNTYKTKKLQRYPVIMPSRGKIFRD